MSPQEALAALQGRALAVVGRGAIEAMKELHARCLAQDLPAALRRPPEPGG